MAEVCVCQVGAFQVCALEVCVGVVFARAVAGQQQVLDSDVVDDGGAVKASLVDAFGATPHGPLQAGVTEVGTCEISV